MSVEVAKVDVDREHAVTVTFVDGFECRLELEELRTNCPCATCRGLREQGEEAWPRPNSPRPLAITDARLVGGWGLGLTWNDGHDTGIFPWDALRRWRED